MTRRGMTLVEMLVAMAATLIIMAAVGQAFSAFGDAISGSRAVIELDSRMRAAAWRLRSDLAGATAQPNPPLSPASGEGYLEIIEGPNTDVVSTRFYDVATGTMMSSGSSFKPATSTWVPGFHKMAATAPGPGTASDDRLLGDVDDALLLTTRSIETPFIGRTAGTGSAIDDTFESTLAEVGWFARPTPGTSNPVTYTLYRKQMLVMGYVGADPFHSGLGENNSIPVPANHGNLSISNATPLSDFYNLPCDVSVRLERTTAGARLFPNTLADLTRREARFMHNNLGLTGTATINATGTTGFPFVFAYGDHQSVVPPNGLFFQTAQRQGEDIILTNVLAFDVRVFDPTAPVYVTAGGTPLLPGDDVTGDGIIDGDDTAVLVSGTHFPFQYASGGYVDLGHSVAGNALLAGLVPPHFSGTCQAKSQLNVAAPSLRVYDTWSLHYEANGLNEDRSTEDFDQDVSTTTATALSMKRPATQMETAFSTFPAKSKPCPPTPTPCGGSRCESAVMSLRAGRSGR